DKTAAASLPTLASKSCRFSEVSDVLEREISTFWIVPEKPLPMPESRRNRSSVISIGLLLGESSDA
ncbi:MAG: hypothetical protein ACI8T1_005467, partial [Verrucomicrobiales bacterium]